MLERFRFNFFCFINNIALKPEVCVGGGLNLVDDSDGYPEEVVCDTLARE